MKCEHRIDVSERLTWFPVVTMLQSALKMAIPWQLPRCRHFYVAPADIDALPKVVQTELRRPAHTAEPTAIFEHFKPPF